MPYKDPERKAAYDAAWKAAHWKNMSAEQREARRRAGLLYTKKYRDANREKLRAYYATRRAEYAAKSANESALNVGVVGRITADDVRAAWEASPCCVYCGGPGIGLDHVVPLVRGGPNERANLVRCCPYCNARKARRTPEEWLRALVLTDRGRGIRP